MIESFDVEFDTVSATGEIGKFLLAKVSQGFKNREVNAVLIWYDKVCRSCFFFFSSNCTEISQAMMVVQNLKRDVCPSVQLNLPICDWILRQWHPRIILILYFTFNYRAGTMEAPKELVTGISNV